MATIHSIERWVREAEGRVRDAKRGGNTSSIAAAEAALEEVHAALRQMAPRLWEIDCPHVGCPFVAVAENEGQAVRKISGHIVRAHTPQGAWITAESLAAMPSMGRVS